jgi:hypothetical protein
LLVGKFERELEQRFIGYVMCLGIEELWSRNTPIGRLAERDRAKSAREQPFTEEYRGTKLKEE